MRKIEMNKDMRLSEVLKRSKKLYRVNRWSIDEKDQSCFRELKTSIKRRAPRIVFLDDDSLSSKRLQQVIDRYHSEAHVFKAENVTQALIEIELREYDILALDIKKHHLHADLFMEIIQRQYDYLNILLLNYQRELEFLPLAKTRKIFMVDNAISKSELNRIFKNIFKSHSIFRKQMRSKSVSVVDQKLSRLKHSA